MCGASKGSSFCDGPGHLPDRGNGTPRAGPGGGVGRAGRGPEEDKPRERAATQSRARTSRARTSLEGVKAFRTDIAQLGSWKTLSSE